MDVVVEQATGFLAGIGVGTERPFVKALTHSVMGYVMKQKSRYDCDAQVLTKDGVTFTLSVMKTASDAASVEMQADAGGVKFRVGSKTGWPSPSSGDDDDDDLIPEGDGKPITHTRLPLPVTSATAAAAKKSRRGDKRGKHARRRRGPAAAVNNELSD